MKETCPNGCDLRGEPIPQKYRDAGHYGPNPPTHYSRLIGHDGGRVGIYDGVVFWSCPDCDAKWHRFVEGDPRREEVEQLWAVQEARRSA